MKSQSACLCVVVASAVACAGTSEPAATARSSARSTVASNVLRSDYAGSRACAGCHADVYRAWSDSPMRRMTRLPAELAGRSAPFDGSTFRFKDDSARMEERGGTRFMRVTSKTFGDHLYRVTKVIGGRYREDYAGLEVASEAEGAPVIGDPGAELILPVSYLVRSGGFRLKGYSVMVGERRGMAAGNIWNQACAYCHNTSPYFSTMLGALAGPKPPSFQGVVVDRILPRSRRTVVEVTDPDALERAVADEIRFFGEAPGEDADPLHHPLVRQAIGATRSKLGERHLVEVGIGCEACHNGSREHVTAPSKLPSFDVKSSFLQVRRSDGRAMSRAESINRTCARCHQVLFTRYPFTWEGSLREDAKGGSNITSGEARDFLLGGCSGAMSCVDCHDPHAEDKPARLEELQSRAGNAVCARCHAALASDAGLRAHAHHDPAGAGGACVACHMPKKNMGLGYELTRYHRIGSPTDAARVLGDRPLECATCHADRSVERLVAEMERLWGKRYDRAKLRELYGDLDGRVLERTLERGKAHEKVVAMDALARSHARSALPLIADGLTNDFPLVRYFARQALETATGAPCPIDLEREREDIRRDVDAWLAAQKGAAPPGPTAER